MPYNGKGYKKGRNAMAGTPHSASVPAQRNAINTQRDPVHTNVKHPRRVRRIG